LKEITTSEN